MQSKEQTKGMRFGGLLCLVVGGGICYFNVYQLLELAANRASQISFSDSAAAGPPLVFVGLMCLFFPRLVLTHVENGRKKRSKVVWIFIALFAVSGLLFSMWLEAQLRAFGYQQVFQ